MTWRRALWGLLALGVIALAARGFFALDLTRDQQADFLGSAFGAFIAAATALGVVEFQARREAGRVWRVVDHLLFDAHTLAGDYLDARPEDAEQFSSLLAFARTLEMAASIANDHQHHSIGMARVAFALRDMTAFADQASIISREELQKNQDAVSMVEAARSAILTCRQLLLTRSTPQ